MSGMRLPLTLSTTGHAIVFALLVLLVADPPLPQPAVERGIEVVLGQSLPEPQAAVAPKTESQPADPLTIAGSPPQESVESQPLVAPTEPPPTPVPEILSPDQTEPLPPPPHKPVVRQPAITVVRPPQPRRTVSVSTPAASRLAEAAQAATAASQYPAGQLAA